MGSMKASLARLQDLMENDPRVVVDPFGRVLRPKLVAALERESLRIPDQDVAILLRLAASELRKDGKP